jgi:hypothetical protein
MSAANSAPPAAAGLAARAVSPPASGTSCTRANRSNPSTNRLAHSPANSAGSANERKAAAGLAPIAAISLNPRARQRCPATSGWCQSRRKCTFSRNRSVVITNSSPARGLRIAQSSPIPSRSTPDPASPAACRAARLRSPAISARSPPTSASLSPFVVRARAEAPLPAGSQSGETLNVREIGDVTRAAYRRGSQQPNGKPWRVVPGVRLRTRTWRGTSRENQAAARVKLEKCPVPLRIRRRVRGSFARLAFNLSATGRLLRVALLRCPAPLLRLGDALPRFIAQVAFLHHGRRDGLDSRLGGTPTLALHGLFQGAAGQQITYLAQTG